MYWNIDWIMLKTLFLVGLGGGMGSICRYLLQYWATKLFVHPFPVATFVINVAGSFMIGLFYGFFSKGNFAADWHFFLAVGLLGGFTTFSTFSNESLSLLRNGQMIMAGLYIFGSVLLSLIAVTAGDLLGAKLLR